MKVKVFPEHDYDRIAYAEVPDEMMPQLRAIQHIIGGDVEQVRTHRLDMKGNVLLVDGDGRHKQKLPNYRAILNNGYTGVIVGAAVVCGLSEDGTHWESIHE